MSNDNIISKFWDNIADTKKAIKIWILERHESWAPDNDNDISMSIWLEEQGVYSV